MTEMLVKGGTIETIAIAHGGFRAELMTLGASLRKLEVPGHDGSAANVVLGYRDLDAYRGPPRFYGGVIGRYANRIGGARFTLDGVEYHVPANDGVNNLHGGPLGFDQLFWGVMARDARSVTFATESPAGANGFPGRLRVEAAYALGDEGLAISLTATTDAPTIVNLTHHAYFNLAGEASGRSVLDHWLQVPASRYTPVDATLIPTGVLADVAGTAFDFRAAKPIGRDIGAADAQLTLGSGYDHNLVPDAPAGEMRRVATAFDPGSGRVLEVHSTEPGLQFYSGNHLANGPPGTSGGVYGARAGFCLEPQKFPDSPNQPEFPSARLDPGQRYSHAIAFRFRTAGDVAEAFSGQ